MLIVSIIIHHEAVTVLCDFKWRMIVNRHHDVYQWTDLQAFLAKCEEELKIKDMKIIRDLDQKVMEQQVTLEKAGVPSFYATNDPEELRIQMYLLDFVTKLAEMQP